MGKLKHLKNALDMSKAARLKRAAKQGFDTDRRLYRGESYGGRLASGGAKNSRVRVVRDNYREPVYLSSNPDEAARFARIQGDDPAIYPLYARGEIWDYENPEHRGLLRQFVDNNYDDAGKAFDEIAKGNYNYIEDPEALEAIEDAGFSGFRVREVAGVDDNFGIFQEADLRSVNAAFDPEKAGSSNLLASMAGAGVVGGVLASQEAEAAPLGSLAKKLGKKTRKAHHGSPHDFDKFSMAKIGTGEGAQAYGHGLYFTSKEDIAKFYRDQLSEGVKIKTPTGDVYDIPSPKNIGPGGVMDENEWFRVRESILENLDASGVSGLTNDEVDQIILDLATYSKDDILKAEPGYRLADFYTGRRLKALELLETDRAGKIYTVEIPDESLMLDWDLPLSEQPEAIREAIRANPAVSKRLAQWRDSFGEEKIKGEQIYDAFAQDPSNGMSSQPDLASAQLKEQGIPGITYKGATSDERNFVVFDDEMINMIEKGFVNPKILAPLAAGAAATGYALSDVPEDIFNESDEERAAAAQRFAQMRAEKNSIWRKLKGIGEAGLTVGSAIAGGVVSDLSRVSGYLNPFMPVEDTQAGAERIQEAMQYQPSADAAPYLEPLAEGMGVLQEDIERGIDKIPQRVKDAYSEANPRLKGLAGVAADWSI